MDGTLLEAWAQSKSFKKVEGDDGPPPDDPGNPTVNFHGETRTNATHARRRIPTRGWHGKDPAKRRNSFHRPHFDGEPQRSGCGRLPAEARPPSARRPLR